jgi:hypothetical protein
VDEVEDEEDSQGEEEVDEAEVVVVDAVVEEVDFKIYINDNIYFFFSDTIDCIHK